MSVRDKNRLVLSTIMEDSPGQMHAGLRGQPALVDALNYMRARYPNFLSMADRITSDHSLPERTLGKALRLRSRSGVIHLSPKNLTSMGDAVGTLGHELTHLLQSSPRKVLDLDQFLDGTIEWNKYLHRLKQSDAMAAHIKYINDPTESEARRVEKKILDDLMGRVKGDSSKAFMSKNAGKAKITGKGRGVKVLIPVLLAALGLGGSAASGGPDPRES